ncbi:MAG: hypothetical protein CMJ70_09700 [Planctomycetaceae bacterium]|nr:hypothetical protein [Planctomycetaceae bacterium]|tara:strand:- start:1693 stop:2217 length:525 start_codon:yes stop_codon:yes gene_type:complete
MADETHDEDTAPDEELNDDSNDRSEEKPAKKKRKRRSGKKKRAVAADTESPDNAAADDEASDSSASDDDTSDGDTSDGDTAGGEEAAKVEEPPPPPEPDDPDAVQALKDIGARLETNEEGNVWRVFFYEDHTDADVTKMHSLHSLKQVWVIGSKATPECVTQLREQFPNATVYA